MATSLINKFVGTKVCFLVVGTKCRQILKILLLDKINMHYIDTANRWEASIKLQRLIAIDRFVPFFFFFFFLD